MFAMYFHENINFCTQNTTFSSDLELADKAPEFKTKSRTSTGNYMSINILPSISNIYERRLYNQSQTYYDKTFLKYECGFHNIFHAQHCLVSMKDTRY